MIAFKADKLHFNRHVDFTRADVTLHSINKFAAKLVSCKQIELNGKMLELLLSLTAAAL